MTAFDTQSVDDLRVEVEDLVEGGQLKKGRLAGWRTGDYLVGGKGGRVPVEDGVLVRPAAHQPDRFISD